MDYVKWLRSRVGHDLVFLNCASAAIINEKGHLLLQKRRDRNTWGFPGGMIELGESIPEALRREVLEETGYLINILKYIGIYSKYFDEYPNGDRAQTINSFFLCEIKNQASKVLDSETLELKFFDINNTPELVNQQHHDMLYDLINQKGFTLYK